MILVALGEEAERTLAFTRILPATAEATRARTRPEERIDCWLAPRIAALTLVGSTAAPASGPGESVS